MQKDLKEMSILELKAILFDLDQQSKQINAQYQQVGQVLEAKFKEEQEIKSKEKEIEGLQEEVKENEDKAKKIEEKIYGKEKK